MKHTCRILTLGVAVLIAGCKGENGTEPLTPASISIVLAKLVLAAVGETTQASARVLDQNGSVLGGQTVTWSSSNTPVAEVSATGLVTARGEGSAVISASVGSVSGSVIVRIEQVVTGLVKTTGDNQTGAVGQPLSLSPQVRLTDANGSPVPGRSVQFSITAGGGSLRNQAASDDDGRVSVEWTLGQLAEAENGLRAQFGSLFAEFTATSMAGSPGTIEKVSGDGQTGMPLQALPAPFVVRLLDGFGNVIAGHEVMFAPTGGSLAPSPASTDSDGLASAILTLPTTVGLVTVTASVAELAETVQFTATSVAGSPASLEKVSGDGQSGTVLTALAAPLVVKLLDAFGNLLAGHTVTFAASAGSVSPATDQTDASGLASTTVTLPATGGPITVTASVTGVAGVATFTAEAFPQVGLGFGLTVGNNHTCARAADVSWYCWGNNDNGQFGSASASTHLPQQIVGLSLVRVSASAGGHSCGLTSAGIAYCWGLNADGQLGDGTRVDRPTPAKVAGGLRFVRISAGTSHTCALDDRGAAYCWGLGADGRLGISSVDDQETPTLVSGGVVFISIGVGRDQSCGLTASGVSLCWGRNNFGQLGTGVLADRSAPTTVTGGFLFQSLSVGAGHACGVTQAGQGYCWGEDTSGSLGTGTAVQGNPTPGLVLGGLVFTSVIAGGDHTCGLAAALAYCWGENGSGQLGLNNQVDQGAPTVLPMQFGFALVEAGFGNHTCGLTAALAIYCWGANTDGQVGVPAGAPQLQPVQVPGWPR